MNEKPRDDLTMVNGIGPVWQRRLRESGVRTFQDLAALSANEILSRLKPAPTKSAIEAWISQAQELTAVAKSSAKTKSEPEETSEQTNSPGEWKPFASFVVEFLSRTMEGKTEQQRTKVHHVETDTDAKWPGIENVELCRWMLKQMGETTLPALEQEIEAFRVQAQHELDRKLKEQRAAAQRELEQMLEDERNRGQKALQGELNAERSRTQKELEKERTQMRRALERELDEKRTQALLELEQKLEEKRNRTQQALQKELEGEQNQVRKELEQERAQARRALERELDEKRTQALLELEQKLEEERTQARKEWEQEPVTEGQQLQPGMEEKSYPPAPPSETHPGREPRVTPTITQLRAFQPVDFAEPIGTGVPGRPFSGLVSSGELFTFAVDFELTEPAGPEIVQQGMTYHAQLYARDLATGSKEHLGNTKSSTFVEGRSSYVARLTDVTLESGAYELLALVTVQNRHPSINYLRVPLFQVV